MKKKLVLMTSALMAISLLAGCENKHVHNWGEVVYEWSTDHTSCTATRVCEDDERHKETETKDSVYAVTKEAKCEEDGLGRYTVTFDNEGLGVAHFDITLEAIGHEWGEVTYTWSDDYSSCTATRVCKNDSNHIESETADSAYTEIIPATCDTNGSAVYDVAFENKAFETQSHEITLPATGHNWGTPTYTWSDDNLTCTARRVCAHDATHIDTETVNSIYVVVEEAKCEEDGKGRYTADFTKEAFVDQTKDITLEAIDHSLIAHDAHDETCTEAGNAAYWSCERCEKFFSDEEGKNEIENNSWIIPAHHVLTHHEGIASSCQTDGNLEYWTCNECHQYFLDEAGTQLTSAEAIVVKAHHTLEHHAKDPESCTEPGIIEYWHCTVCGNDFYDEDATREVEGEDDLIIPAHHVLTHHVAKDATCTEPGNHEYYSCDVCGKIFQDANAEISLTPGDEIIKAKDHSWGTPTYTWSDDYSTCTATRVCLNDSTHTETETVDSSYDEITPATCTSEGLGRYTVTFENTAFTTQTKDVTLDKLLYERIENKIYFGTYPQTLVSNDTIIAALNTKAGDLPTSEDTKSWIDYNYYISSSVTSFMYYQDIDYDKDGDYDYRGVYFTSYRPYTTVTSSSYTYQEDNGYSTNTIYWFSYDLIEWNILTESDGKALIIANLNLDSQDYYSCQSSETSSFSHNGGDGYANNYELSNIRKFLNDDFYNIAFNDLQKAIIETTEVDNSASSTGHSPNSYACSNTNDKVFLLSYEEATTYYANNTERTVQGTDYAKCQGLQGDNVNNPWWWLRSPHYKYGYTHYVVNYDGDIDTNTINRTFLGVRPVCWINL